MIHLDPNAGPPGPTPGADGSTVVDQSATPCTRGFGIAGTLQWWEAHDGATSVADAMATVVERFPSELSANTDHYGIAPHAWYPATLHDAILTQLLRGRSAQEAELAVDEIALGAARLELGLLTRMMLRLRTNVPERLARIAVQRWREFNDTGQLVVVKHGRREHHIVIQNWDAHSLGACALNTQFRKHIYTLLGCKGVEATTLRCVDRGASACVTRITWAQ